METLFSPFHLRKGEQEWEAGYKASLAPVRQHIFIAAAVCPTLGLGDKAVNKQGRACAFSGGNRQ